MFKKYFLNVYFDFYEKSVTFLNKIFIILGVCCVGGKAYKQVVNYRFHLTMAVLDPKCKFLTLLLKISILDFLSCFTIGATHHC